MAADRVEIVHPPTGVRALIKSRLLPGWQRQGWVPADETPAEPAPRRRGAHQPPATVPGTTDDLAAGSSSHEEGAQP